MEGEETMDTQDLPDFLDLLDHQYANSPHLHE